MYKRQKEDKASWVNFFQWLRGRGLDGVKLIVGDKCMGMLEAVGEVFPDAKDQRCTCLLYTSIVDDAPVVNYRNEAFINAVTGGLLDAYKSLYEEMMAEYMEGVQQG